MKNSLIKFSLVFILPILVGQPVLAKMPISSSAKIMPSPLILQAKIIQNALATQRYDDIIPYIHPIKGVRFSMYSQTSNSEKDKVFSRKDFKTYLKKSNIKFTWGEQDGSGEPLVISLSQYLTTWVKAKTSNDAEITTGNFVLDENSLENWGKYYPNFPYVTFNYKGTKQYEEMDWQKLTFVFDNYQGKPYLVAILNSQWMI